MRRAGSCITSFKRQIQFEDRPRITGGGDHSLPRKCDPRKCPEEINPEKQVGFPLTRALSTVKSERMTATRWRDSGLLREYFAKVGREPETLRLGGCARSLEPTGLSLQFGKCRVILPNCRDSIILSQKKPSHLNGWVGLSLIQGAGRPSFQSREGLRNPARRGPPATITQLS
jgi:hypothetical protein